MTSDRSFQLSARNLILAQPSKDVHIWQRRDTRVTTTCKLKSSSGNWRRRSGDASANWGRNSWVQPPGIYGIGFGAGGLFLFDGGSLAYAAPLPGLRPGPPARRQKRSKKRIMFLMSDTGGGHRASAQALKAGFEALYGHKYQIDIVDIWSHHTPYPFNQLPHSYSFMVRYPLLWWLSYNTTQPRCVRGSMNRIAYAIAQKQLGEAYAEYDPDLVVSVHPLMNYVPLRVLRKRIDLGLQDPINFATVVTDLTTCHNQWFERGVTKCFVATEYAKQLALNNGLTPQQVVVHGLPIRPEFGRVAKRDGKRKLRKKLGLDLNKPTVLIVGGGEGMGPVQATVKALAAAQVDCTVVVVCGRNKKLQQKLASSSYPACMRVSVWGFVDNMAEWMCASDAIITKAGPGTISEALIAGLPVLLNANVPCQEEGNVPFVIENKVGACQRDPVAAAATIQHWFSEEGRTELEDMSRRARKIAHPDAVFHIVRDLKALVV